jgi:hypothetical protein
MMDGTMSKLMDSMMTQVDRHACRRYGRKRWRGGQDGRHRDEPTGRSAITVTADPAFRERMKITMDTT